MNDFKSKLVEKLEIRGPLIIAPMAGGPTTPRLVAATSNAGALGSLGGAYMAPGELREAITQTKALTQRPFAVNLFVPAPEVKLSNEQIQNAQMITEKYRKKLGLPAPIIQPPYQQDFYEQVEVVLAAKPKAFSFIFGLVEKSILNEFKKIGIVTIGTATCLQEALELEESGVDAIVAQGVDAGGHRGMFSSEDADPMLGTVALTRVLVKKIKIPVIAAGGIMDGQGITAVLQVGAQAAQLGTAFLLCEEAGTSKPYRDLLLAEHKRSTCLTRAFSGRWARGLENEFIKDMSGRDAFILPFPAQNVFTRDIRAQSVKQNNPEYLSLWAGSGVSLIRNMSAAALVREFFEELNQFE
jgi:nitronate monooxygenase